MPDNTNLDKARALLYPLKRKYGRALSWGDLFILAGTVAYSEAGAPISRMCFGRVDEPDGGASMILNEPYPGGTRGLIYVNPEGVEEDGVIVADPARSVQGIRTTFGVMGHSANGTVALIGGGHTVGKCHGPCKAGAGNPPDVAFAQGTQIWQGGCGTGKGPDTFTSGFEGYWTSKPFEWDNEFFTDLLDKKWMVKEGPAGNKQWYAEGTKNIRLTSDMALLYDAEYRQIVERFAANSDEFDKAFDKAWFDLTTTNVGGEWARQARCDDGSVPPGAPTRRPHSVLRNDEGPPMAS